MSSYFQIFLFHGSKGFLDLLLNPFPVVYEIMGNPSLGFQNSLNMSVLNMAIEYLMKIIKKEGVSETEFKE